MKLSIRSITSLVLAVVMSAVLAYPCKSMAADTAAISRDAQAALQKLYETNPAAKTLGEKAKAILVFPSIEAGNIFFKTCTYLAKAELGAVVAGANCPCVLTSRGDSEDTKFYSIALASLLS